MSRLARFGVDVFVFVDGIRGSGRALGSRFTTSPSFGCVFFLTVKGSSVQIYAMHTLISAHCTLNFLLSNTIPSFDIVSNALSASSLIAKETYPTPFDTPVPCSRTTKADLTGAMSENNVCKSVEVAVYGRLDTKSVDLLIFQ